MNLNFEGSFIKFSTSVELESQNVCMYVYVFVCPRTLGKPSKRNNWSTELKFGTPVPKVNPQGCFFIFLISIFFASYSHFTGNLRLFNVIKSK